MRINHNIGALNTHRQLTTNNTNQSKSIEKLSSGLRINRAGDDAAGLAISEKMRGQIRGLDQASRNAQDGISLIQTAEGALNETQSILQRMRELAVQASNDTNADTDRGELQKEINQLTEEIDRIANTTEFNTKKLLDGSLNGVNSAAATTSIANKDAVFTAATVTTVAADNTYHIEITSGTSAGSYTLTYTDASGATGTFSATSTGGAIDFSAGGQTISVTLGSLSSSNIGDDIVLSTRKAIDNLTDNSLSFQIGANSGQNMDVDIEKMDSASLHVNGVKVTTAAAANATTTAVNKAIEQVSAERAKLGAFQNRIEHTINNLQTSSENLTAAESRIRDVDMAKEMMEQTKNSILSQAAQAMLAQANQQPQGVLQLLR